MMKTFPKLAVLLSILFAFSACGPTLQPFTKEIYDDYTWSDGELKSIQFYLSDAIVLRREMRGGKAEIQGGKVKMIEGKKIEEVVIPKGTPGVFLFSPKKGHFAVSFDSNDDLYLVFGPNPKVNDRYLLLASKWDRKSGVVTYGAKKWKVDAGSAWSGLMVDLKKVHKVSVQSNKAKGRTVQ